MMANTGYSGKPIWQKLGIKPTTTIILVAAPADYEGLIGWPSTLNVVKRGKADMIHCFARNKEELASAFPGLPDLVSEGGCIWISWYKKSAGIATDLTEDIIRDIVLPTGWVDTKVCAVSEQWSGLKVVKRKK